MSDKCVQDTKIKCYYSKDSPSISTESGGMSAAEKYKASAGNLNFRYGFITE